MNAQTKVALEDISEENAPAIYVAGGLNQFLTAVQAEVSAEVPDLTTRKGRERIASLAAKVSKSKAAVEKPGRDYLRKLKEMPKVVEAELRDFVTAMDLLRDETRKPLTEWEEAEKARVAQHESGIAYLKNIATEGMSAAVIGAMIQDLDSTVIGDDWQEFEAEAHRAKAASLEVLRAALAKQEQVEAEQAELAELRRKQAEQEQREREERAAKEAAEKARQEAEVAAQAEREAAANRERDLQLKAERAERERLEGEQRAAQAEREAQARIEKAEQDAAQAAERERQRQVAEQQRIADEAAAREADVAHKTAILTSIKEAFMTTGVSEDQARAIIHMIRKGEVPSVSISY